MELLDTLRKTGCQSIPEKYKIYVYPSKNAEESTMRTGSSRQVKHWQKQSPDGVL